MYSGQGGLQQQLNALWRKYSRKHPRRVLRAGDLKPHGIDFCYYLPYALHFRTLVVEAADMELFAQSARTAASRAHRTWGG